MSLLPQLLEESDKPQAKDLFMESIEDGRSGTSAELIVIDAAHRSGVPTATMSTVGRPAHRTTSCALESSKDSRALESSKDEPELLHASESEGCPPAQIRNDVLSE